MKKNHTPTAPGLLLHALLGNPSTSHIHKTAPDLRRIILSPRDKSKMKYNICFLKTLPCRPAHQSLWSPLPSQGSERRHRWDSSSWPLSSHPAFSVFNMSHFKLMKKEDAQCWEWTKPPQLKLQITLAWAWRQGWIFDWGQFYLLWVFLFFLFFFFYPLFSQAVKWGIFQQWW